ncbi:hypothetical protein QM646_00695 [Rhodococcus erythropolis]|nr:hypothetical protein [Rhodococcus erythropolis]
MTATTPKTVAARILLAIGFYSPTRTAAASTCRTLVQIMADDAITPASAAQKTASKIPHTAIHIHRGGHLEPYVEPMYPIMIDEQLAFQKRSAPDSLKDETPTPTTPRDESSPRVTTTPNCRRGNIVTSPVTLGGVGQLPPCISHPDGVPSPPPLSGSSVWRERSRARLSRYGKDVDSIDNREPMHAGLNSARAS